MNDKNTEVLQQYELDVSAIRRGRGAWICETDRGVKLLKEYKGTVKRLEFEDSVLEQIQIQGYPYIDRYVRNREESLISVGDDGTRYLVKNWFPDGECNIKDRYDILNAVSRIALLHRMFRNIEFQEEWNMGSILAQPPEQEMERHNKELRRARTYIKNKHQKTDFELCVIGNFHTFYEQAVIAQEGLADLLAGDDQNKLFLCHGELDQHHILMGEYDIAIIEFNKMHLGLQMTDLYHFMRKVMEKHDWNMDLGLSMLEAYDRTLPLSQNDKKCLYFLFLYPEKYWKQINFYFNANKAWIPARNVEKLRNLQEQLNSRDRFLSKIK